MNIFKRHFIFSWLMQRYRSQIVRKILWQYFISNFMVIFFLALGGFIAIYLVVDLFEKIDDLLEAGVKAGHIFLYFLYKVPLITVQGMPIAVLLAALISFGILGRNNELIALKSTGINLLRCVLPILAVSFFLSTLDFALNQTIVPFSLERANAIWQKKGKRGRQSASVAQGKIWCRSANVILSAAYFDNRQNLLKKVTLFVFDSNFDLIRRLDALEARWSGEDWIFLNGLDQKKEKNAWVASPFKARILPIEVNPVGFETVQRLPDEMTFMELYKYVNRLQADGYDTTFYRLKLHSKISFPATGIVLAILGVSVALLLGRHSSIPLGVALATAAAFIYLLIYQFSVTLGETGALPPFAGAWLANSIFFLIGCLLLLRAPL